MDMTSNSDSLSFDDMFEHVSNKNKTESTMETIDRNLAQNTARGLETVFGMPGNIKRQVLTESKTLKSFLPDFIKSFLPPEQEQEMPEEGSFNDYLFNPPTTPELKESITKKGSEKVFGRSDYLDPINDTEKAFGEFTQDLVSMFMPGTGALRMITRIGAPIAGNLVKQGIKFFGGSEETAEKAKLGIMLATTLANQSNPGAFANERIGQARAMVPDTATVNATNLATRLLPLYGRLRRGLNVPSKSRTMQGMGDLAAQVENGRINLQSLMDARNNVNEWISEAGGWDVPTNTRDAGLRNLNELKRSIINTIDENLATRFPEAGELYRTGYEAAAVTHQSNAISNFIERNFGKQVASTGAKLLFPALTGGASIFPKTVGIGAAAYPIYKAGQVLYRVGQSPTLAGYYSDVISSSLRGNAPQMIQSLARLDRLLAKEEKERQKDKPMSLEEFKRDFIDTD